MKHGVAWFVAALILVSAARTRAEIEPLDVKLTLEGSLLSWSKISGTYADDSELKRTRTLTGLLSGGYVALGLAAHRYLVPTLFVGLQQAKYENPDVGSSQLTRDWDLRPALEVPLLPNARLVPFASAGLSLARTVDRFEERSGPDAGTLEFKSFRLGPAISVGLHGFIVQQASLDVSLTYRALFLAASEHSPADFSGGYRPERRDHTLLLNLGASFWL